MSRTDKDAPWFVRKARNELKNQHYYQDSGFRKYRKWLKRQRSKAIRRSANPNLKRTWDFY